MLGLELAFRIQDDKLDEFRQTTSTVYPHGLKEAGLYTNVLCPGAFLWAEHGYDANRLDERIRSPEFRVLLGAIETLGTLQSFRKVRTDPAYVADPQPLRKSNQEGAT